VEQAGAVFGAPCAPGVATSGWPTGGPAGSSPESGSNGVVKFLGFSANAWDGCTDDGSVSVIISDGWDAFASPAIVTHRFGSRMSEVRILSPRPK